MKRCGGEVGITASNGYALVMSYTPDSTLEIDTVIADRTVIAKTLIHERIVGDRFATWVAICVDHNAIHPFVVWTVVARPEGWHAEQGDYFTNVDDAIIGYYERGGGA